jgi:hypothetical protein
MSLQCSEGFKKALLGPASFAQIFRYGAIHIYSGAQPATANDAATGTLLGTVTVNGGSWAPGSILNGLLFQQAGVWVRGDPTQTWVLKGSNTGIAGWFRLVENASSGSGADFDHCRIDGAISVTPGAAEMRLSTLSIDPSTSVVIDHLFYTIPPILGA